MTGDHPGICRFNWRPYIGGLKKIGAVLPLCKWANVSMAAALSHRHGALHYKLHIVVLRLRSYHICNETSSSCVGPFLKSRWKYNAQCHGASSTAIPTGSAQTFSSQLPCHSIQSLQ